MSYSLPNKLNINFCLVFVVVFDQSGNFVLYSTMLGVKGTSLLDFFKAWNCLIFVFPSSLFWRNTDSYVLDLDMHLLHGSLKAITNTIITNTIELLMVLEIRQTVPERI